MRLALLPLTLHLLPEGRVPLRIFEPKYVRMVAEAGRDERGFGIGMLEEPDDRGKGDLYMLGARVKIVDFYTLDDGLLGITVEATERFRIRALEREADGLLQAEVELLDNWRSCSLSPVQQILSDKLQEVFSEYPELADLHPRPRWQDAAWVTQRWLEVLPIKNDYTQLLMSEPSCHRALTFLLSMITPEPRPGQRH
ncbi:LON peptidase substrate-binding domain-containing protein [Oceanimonas pelagia]|uniref:LON peptidase substrate-binding domain-containing protein n=1 Tax=Oceanimonas pelagia TaxID=3028314 RepID=A0AA50QBM2_9GAMM|nr:LON peptidase substrate-binding domain-containing protein [Oceanimonas pelagia]WMC10299.1 LON peptidase substrate-binding domain-containing protein [Oceanimonas pelagia]